MPISPLHVAKPKPTGCPKHLKAVILLVRKLGEDRLQWICMDCGKRLGDGGPVDYSKDKFFVG